MSADYLVARHIADPQTSWAIGTFGAITEFHRDPCEAVAPFSHDGPHTHVMRALLKHRRTHSANMPLPECLVPCAEMFPASAIHDAHGRRQPFDFAKHEALQKLLSEHGAPLCVKAKSETVAAIRAGRPPFDEPSYNRAQRLARRVALRQIAQTDGPSRLLAAWHKMFDRV